MLTAQKENVLNNKHYNWTLSQLRKAGKKISS